ncbi:TIR domain-containing protein [Luteibacter sp. PPL201]|uniref:TIR domain-containing protein n=1 Tax=Luteibacter sahnii TaxID=3021977 RepID=A0ABT6BC82_9GAMM
MARRTFFSFHYEPDVWRAWNVRNAWVVRPSEQDDVGFFDSSVVEATKRTGKDQLKTFLRNGLHNTSVTCVLAGTNTWQRPWVRYEIAQSVLRGNGLLTVGIHGVRDANGLTSEVGADPLSAMGVYRANDSGNLYLAEWQSGKWVKYSDYGLPIAPSALWFPAPTTADVVPFSRHAMRYDFSAQNGRENIAGWIELAAQMVGR